MPDRPILEFIFTGYQLLLCILKSAMFPAADWALSQDAFHMSVSFCKGVPSFLRAHLQIRVFMLHRCILSNLSSLLTADAPMSGID